MKEIGGYFGLEEFSHKEYYPELVALNNARNALVYLIRAKKIKKIYIPYYLCNSVSDVLDREGCEYMYYSVDENFQPQFDSTLGANEWIYVVNYFGQVTNEAGLKEKYARMIFDNVQAFFQEPVEGIDTIYSCRKFFGVPDGGYLSTDVVLDGIAADVSLNRMKHILGRYEGESATKYYTDFKANDRSFADLELRMMSRLTHNLLGAIDYVPIKSKREENFRFLHNKLGKFNKLNLTLPVGPYAYPFYHENGMTIKKNLAEKKIYVATLWPNVIDGNDPLGKDYSENILPLPCDQRYGTEEMSIIVNELLKYV